MTAPVEKRFGGIGGISGLRIAKPVLSAHLSAEAQALNHLLGAQLTLHTMQGFGPSEPNTGTNTYRYQYYAHPNAKNIVIAVVPRGYRSGVTEGTVAAGGRTVDITQADADITDLGDLALDAANACIFEQSVTAGALQEVTFATTDVAPHTAVIYESRRTMLSGNEEHIDRSFADPGLYITDDPATEPNPRGLRAYLDELEVARANTAPCPVSFYFAAGVAVSTSSPSWGTAYGPIRCRARALYNGVTKTRVRFWFYIGTIGAGTFSIRVRDAATTDTATIAGITTTGWKGSTSPPTLLSHGLAFDMQNDAVDEITIEAQRTAGAGSITINGVSTREDAV